MRRQSDIGWTELILGIVLIILGIFIIKQPVGIITWIVVLCGLIAVFSGIADIVLYVKMERFTGFGPIISLVTGILGIMAGFMLMVHPSAEPGRSQCSFRSGSLHTVFPDFRICSI